MNDGRITKGSQQWLRFKDGGTRRRLLADAELVQIDGCTPHRQASEEEGTADGTDEHDMRSTSSCSGSDSTTIDVEGSDNDSVNFPQDIARTASLSSRGITMDLVFGCVRTKRGGGEAFCRTPSLTSLSQAVGEAASQCSADLCERMCRSLSAAGEAPSCLGGGRSKRARSGAYSSPEARPFIPTETLGAVDHQQGGPGEGELAKEEEMVPPEAGARESTGARNGVSPGVGVGGGAEGSVQAEAESGGLAVRAGGYSGNGAGARAGAGAGARARAGTGEGVRAGGEKGDKFRHSQPACTSEEYMSLLKPLMQRVPEMMHPEQYLHGILRERGYLTELVPSMDTSFNRPPSPRQVSAYGKDIVQAVLSDDIETLGAMRAEGRSMDACNRFGDSILHMACRRGRARALSYLLGECRVRTELSDDCGRTLLHDACWTAAPRFDVVSMVLDLDLRLLRVTDKRGSSPLQYVPQEHWQVWCAFLESKKDVYWAPLGEGCEDSAGVMPRLKPSR